MVTQLTFPSDGAGIGRLPRSDVRMRPTDTEKSPVYVAHGDRRAGEYVIQPPRRRTTTDEHRWS